MGGVGDVVICSLLDKVNKNVLEKIKNHTENTTIKRAVFCAYCFKYKEVFKFSWNFLLTK